LYLDILDIVGTSIKYFDKKNSRPELVYGIQMKIRTGVLNFTRLTQRTNHSKNQRIYKQSLVEIEEIAMKNRKDIEIKFREVYQRDGDRKVRMARKRVGKEKENGQREREQKKGKRADRGKERGQRERE
jgi:hypothetical protein